MILMRGARVPTIPGVEGERRLEQAAEAYRRRGPRWDVIVPGALAVLMLVSALADADAAISRALRAF